MSCRFVRYLWSVWYIFTLPKKKWDLLWAKIANYVWGNLWPKWTAWSFLKTKYTLLNVGIVFVKHTLKFRKCKNISDNKNTFRDVPWIWHLKPQYFFANLSFPRAFNALDNSLNVTDSPLSNQTINIWNDFSFTPGYCTGSACISSMLAFGTFNFKS